MERLFTNWRNIIASHVNRRVERPRVASNSKETINAFGATGA